MQHHGMEGVGRATGIEKHARVCAHNNTHAVDAVNQLLNNSYVSATVNAASLLPILGSAAAFSSAVVLNVLSVLRSRKR